MVQRRSRPPVGEPNAIRSPGLDVQPAREVPFIPATRRSGVGQNEARMASALSRLSSAVGVFAKSQGLGPKSQSEIDAERLRHDKYLAERSKDSPEERALWKQAHGYHPVATTLEKAADYRQTYLPQLQKKLTTQLEEWKNNGWTYKDEEGQPVQITQEFLDKWFANSRQAEVYDVYGDGKGEKGRLHDPQIKMITKEINTSYANATANLNAWNKFKTNEAGFLTAQKDSYSALGNAFVSGNLRGQNLLDAWRKSGRETWKSVTGQDISGDSTMERKVFENQLIGVYRNMTSLNDVRLWNELLNQKMPNGSMVRDMFPEKTRAILKKAGDIVTKHDTANTKALVTEEFFKNMATGGTLTASEVAGRDYKTSTGKNISITKSELEAAVVNRARALTGLSPDLTPGEVTKEDNKVKLGQLLRFFEGKDILIPEVKAMLGNLNLNVQNPEEVGGQLELFREIRRLDKAKLEKYMSKDTRTMLSGLDGILTANPAMSLEQAITTVRDGLTEEGKIPNWTQLQLQNAPNATRARSLRGTYNELAASFFKGMTQSERSELDAAIRLRIASGQLDTDADGEVSRSELRTALKEEGKRFQERVVTLNNSIVRAPLGYDGTEYKAYLEAFLPELAKATKTDKDSIQFRTVPGNTGLDFTVNGQTLMINGKRASYRHSQIMVIAKQLQQGKSLAEAMRKLGHKGLARHTKEMEAQIKEAKEKAADYKSMWHFMFPPSEAPGFETTTP